MTRKDKQAADTSDREIVLERHVNAPRELVFEVWTKPQHIARWWGPNGFTNTVHEMDVRPGGIWRYTMHGPDGTDYRNLVIYKKVDPPALLVYLHGDEDEGSRRRMGLHDRIVGEDAGPDSEFFHVTVTFEEAGGGTRLTMRMLLATAEQRDKTVEFGAIEGGNQTLTRLEKYLDEIRTQEGTS